MGSVFTEKNPQNREGIVIVGLGENGGKGMRGRFDQNKLYACTIKHLKQN